MGSKTAFFKLRNGVKTIALNYRDKKEELLKQKVDKKRQKKVFLGAIKSVGGRTLVAITQEWTDEVHTKM